MLMLVLKANNFYEIFLQGDTINLFSYAVRRLTPRALSSGVSSWSYLRKGSTGSNPTSVSLLDSLSVSEQFKEENSRHVLRPLKHDKWSKGKDGFLFTDIWGVEVGGSLISETPTVWLQQTEERMYLCIYQYKSLTLIFLIPVSSIFNGEQGVSMVKQQVLENVSTLLLSRFFLFLSFPFCFR